MKTRIKMNDFSCIMITLLFLAASFQAIANDVNIGLFVSKQAHVTGEASPVLSITAENIGPAVVQDIHLGVISPDGTIYEFPDWNNSLQPWLPGYLIPADLILPNTVITNLDTVPGGLTPGIWLAYFALTNSGTIEITEVQLEEFNVVNSLGSGGKYGLVSVQRTQSISGTSVSASGAFYEGNTSFPDLIAQIQGQMPNIDQCIFNEMQIDLGNITDFITLSVDAGQVSVDNGGGSIEMDKQIASSIISYDSEPSLNFFDSASDFTFSGNGGVGVGPFMINVEGAKPFTLLSPDVTSNLNINSEQNMVLTWDDNPDGGEVLATLVGSDIDITNLTAARLLGINCRFNDDGEGIIPANLLAQLKLALPSDPGFPVTIPDSLPFAIPLPGLGNNINLNISRTNYRFFNTTGAPELTSGYATVSSGAALIGQFQ